MKWTVIGLAVLGLVTAFCAAVLLGAVRAGGFGQLRLHGIEAGDPDVTVMFAGKPMPSMSIVSGESVVARTLPRSKAPNGYASNAVEVVGKVLAVPVVEGQALTTSCFATEGVGTEIAASLASGKRAVGISVTDYASLIGMLYPGCTVDVLVSFRPSDSGSGPKWGPATMTLLEGVEVLAIEKRTVVSKSAGLDEDPEHTGRANNGRRVTLLVDSKQAKLLQLAMQQGTLSLALRNPLDNTPSDGALVSLRDLYGEEFGPPASAPETPVADAGDNTAVAPSLPQPGEAALPRTPNNHLWDVTVIRGGAIETQYFSVSPDEDPRKDRD